VNSATFAHKVWCSGYYTPFYLKEYGSNQNLAGGLAESNHKEFIKKNVKHTQRRKDTQDEQIACQQTKRLVLMTAQGLVDVTISRNGYGKSNNTGEPPKEQTIGGTKFVIEVFAKEVGFLGEEEIHHTLSWTSSHKEDHPPTLEPPREALDHIVSIVDKARQSAGLEYFPEVTLPCFTECKRGDQIYRSHPNYRKDGPWFDWAYFLFEYETGDDSQEIPGQTWFFVDLS
jgi:hypothetical protein